MERQASQGVAILGSTGSIGQTALKVIARHSELFHVVALTAHSNHDQLREQSAKWNPKFTGIVSHKHDCDLGWSTGSGCLVEAATHSGADIVLNAVVGAAGLDATLAALAAGKRVALANKETLVLAGDVVMSAARSGSGSLVPVDSEHSAILQCLSGRTADQVKRLVITASGGPFRTWRSEDILNATVQDALNHPTWSMGSKITVDSATLANKALEVIEAHHLFGVDYANIEVVVHPQSLIHSFVEFKDGSVVAQIGVPSMELPILYAFTHPERISDDGIPAYDPVSAGGMTFETVRHSDFPMLGLGIRAGRAGGSAPAVFNAANEVAVAAFLDGRIGFGGIAGCTSDALDKLADLPGATLQELLNADAAARRHVQSMI